MNPPPDDDPEDYPDADEAWLVPGLDVDADYRQLAAADPAWQAYAEAASLLTPEELQTRTTERVLRALHFEPETLERVLETESENLPDEALLELAIEALKLGDPEAGMTLAQWGSADRVLPHLRLAALRLRRYDTVARLTAELDTEIDPEDLFDCGDPDYIRQQLVLVRGLPARLCQVPEDISCLTTRVLNRRSDTLFRLWIDYLRDHDLPLYHALIAALYAGAAPAVDLLLPLIPDLNAQPDNAGLTLVGALSPNDSPWCAFLREEPVHRLASGKNFPAIAFAPDADTHPSFASPDEITTRQTELLRRLLGCGFSPHGRPPAYSPLSDAIFHRIPIPFLEILLHAGASPNVPHADGRTPLCLAYASIELETVRFLLNRGADPEAVFRNPEWFADATSAINAPPLSGPEIHAELYALLDTLPWTPDRLAHFVSAVSGLTVAIDDTTRIPQTHPVALFLLRWPNLPPDLRDAIQLAHS